MTWNKGAALAVIGFCLLSRAALAADIDAQVAHDFAGWDVDRTVQGDLNGDGKADAAVIVWQAAKDDEAGKAQLVVYLDDGQGNYKIKTKAPKAICVGCGGPKAVSGEPLGELSISEGGVLHVTYEGGSREEYDDELKWRLDKAGKDFQLIGETQHIVDTLGEEPDDDFDVNYLSLKAEKSVGKKKRTCKVAPEFRAIALSSFDYEDKHIDDMEKLSQACNKR